MNFKATIVTTIAAGALIGVAAGFIQARAAQADGGPVDATGVAAIACSTSPGNWNDCTVTLNQGIPAGGSVAAMLESHQAQVLYCSEGNADPDFVNCGITGNAAVFYCPNSCGAGSRFILSALGSAPNLAASFTVGATLVESPNSSPLDFGPVPVRIGTAGLNPA
jgi:hypothetical protein